MIYRKCDICGRDIEEGDHYYKVEAYCIDHWDKTNEHGQRQWIKELCPECYGKNYTNDIKKSEENRYPFKFKRE